MTHLRAVVVAAVVLVVSAAIARAEVAPATTKPAAKPAVKATVAVRPLTTRQVRIIEIVDKHRDRFTAAASESTKTKLQPAVVKVLERAAVKPSGQQKVDLVVDAKGAVYASFGSLPDGDIEALAYLVLMQASKSAQDDLKAAMASVKAINDAKRCLRQKKKTCDDQVKARKDLSAAQVDAVVQAMGASEDSLSELGETESLRMQMAMDRLSKLLTTLSNLQKKIADTQASVISNLK